MPAQEHLTHDSHIDRLVNQRDALSRHLVDLKKQVVETSLHLAAVSENIARMRNEMYKHCINKST